MEKSTYINRPLGESPMDRLTKYLRATGAGLAGFLPTIASADVKEATKSGGTTIIAWLFVVLIVVSGISLLIGFILRGTGNEQQVQKSNSRIFHALIAIFGGACTGLLITWVWNAATSAGGGPIINWPF
ncbi:hypothetical protein [uncultured Leuconostoc sp.]|uniref:hypothetical protein n=1 Tax=uncultured Leuconostoc sp. TaxID=173262 RepID=UPI002592336A|nr:hypothetical protein [uncultured Leuconostoc sp.]